MAGATEGSLFALRAIAGGKVVVETVGAELIVDTIYRRTSIN